MVMDLQAETLQAPNKQIFEPKTEQSSHSPERIPFAIDLFSGLGLSKEETEKIYKDIKVRVEGLRGIDNGITLRHSEKSAYITNELAKTYNLKAEELGYKKLTEDQIKNFTLATFLHDIGKGTIENGKYKYADLINKPDVLTTDEKMQMAEHALDGYKILIEAGIPEEIARVSKEHHVNDPVHDHSLATAFTQIADHLDAVTDGSRPYNKTPMSRSAAYAKFYKEDVDRLKIQFGLLPLAYEQFCLRNWIPSGVKDDIASVNTKRLPAAA